MAGQAITGTAAILWGSLSKDTAFLYDVQGGSSSLVFYVTGGDPTGAATPSGTSSIIFQAHGGALDPVKLPPWTAVDGPSKVDSYEWRLPNNEDQHGEQTVDPGDLLIKPSDLALVPTNAPKQSGVQHGLNDWLATNAPSQSWYVSGDTIASMTDDWTPTDGPSKDDTYEWRLPQNEDQYGEQTVDPGDLLIKPSDLALVPTNSPKREGVQHGQDDWNYTATPETGWYVIGDSFKTMATDWSKTAGASNDDTYEWRLPQNEDQHTEQTADPGDLLIKPSDIELVPTKSPKRSGVQHGQDDWNYNSVPDSSWYVNSTPEDC